MKTAFFSNNDFTYFAEISKVEAIKDAFSLKITSQLLSARKPEEEQTQLQVTCTKTDIQRLAGLLMQGVNDV